MLTQDDEGLVPVHERGAWAAAVTLPDLGRLVADWLTGTRRWIPTYLADGPDPETGPHVVDALVAVNLAGFLTDSSQPGLCRDGWSQRAFVTGLADPAVAQLAEWLAVGTDLVVVVGDRALAPGAEGEHPLVSLAVTAQDGRPVTWCGRFEPVAETLAFHAPVAPQAVPALTDAVALQVIDPVWGRDDVLWPWLHRLAGELGRLAVVPDAVTSPERP